MICFESRGLLRKGKVTALKFLAQRQTEGQTKNKNRTGDNGVRCHLFVKAPRPKGANVGRRLIRYSVDAVFWAGCVPAQAARHPVVRLASAAGA